MKQRKPLMTNETSGDPSLATRRLAYTGQRPIFVPDLGVFEPFETVELSEDQAIALLSGGGWKDIDRPAESFPPPADPPPVRPIPEPTVPLLMTAEVPRRVQGRIFVPGERVDVPRSLVPEFLSRGCFRELASESGPPLPDLAERTIQYVGPPDRAIPGAGLFEVGEQFQAAGPRLAHLLSTGLFTDPTHPEEWLAFNVPPPETLPPAPPVAEPVPPVSPGPATAPEPPPEPLAPVE